MLTIYSYCYKHVSKLTGTDQTQQYHRKPWGGSVSDSAATAQARAEKHSEEEHARCLMSVPAQGRVEVCVVSDGSNISVHLSL